MPLQLTAGRPNQLGARFDGDGTNFAVFSENASQLYLSVFADDGITETDRVKLPERTGHVWHGYAPGLRPGTLYGFRADGVYAPEQGHRFNINKLLMDPYTRELRGEWTDHEATLGYNQQAAEVDLSFDSRDSAPFVPKSVVSSAALFNEVVPRDDVDWTDTLIYEAHPKGLTMQHPQVPASVRGSYEALACEPMLEHLQKLGVTAVELLPTHAFVDDGFLLERGLRNYWGYNTIGFFAPEPRYFGPEGLLGFRRMVQRFHSAGIKVILDVVYNHTAEGNQRGPTLCYRGLDNASYYHLNAEQPRYYVNDTGCGNTLNVAHPYVLRMVMDSLRFWVQQMGVDGFRFDLATTLGREHYGFDRRGGFFDALRQDPVLADARLIAEPWDIGPGGYRVGDFPADFSEWNDGYRDSVRQYWRGDQDSTPALCARLLGSASQFDRAGRRAWTSVNFITAHDGFTLADVVRYNERHNEANGENNADGHGHNLSDNCGVEGDTDDPAIQATRAQRQRNILATLFLSQGTPMLLAGDELSNSQQGNNNAYAQDNPIGWLDWQNADATMTAFVAQLSRFRRDYPQLRQSRFLHGDQRASDGLPDVQWSDLDGQPVQWDAPELSSFCLTLRGAAVDATMSQNTDAVFMVFNRHDDTAQVRLPEVATSKRWIKAVDTADAGHGDYHNVDAATVAIQGHSVVALATTLRKPL